MEKYVKKLYNATIDAAKRNELPVKSQAAIRLTGHAIGFRLYAEDGKVTPFYDLLISKVIVHASKRFVFGAF